MQPITTYEDIGPEKAREYLARNAGNRLLRESHAEHLANEIAAGRWQTSHQGIAFDEHGTMIDGQHRLRAIEIAGKTVRIAVTRGLPSDARKVVDIGRRRSIHDIASLHADQQLNRHLCQLIAAFMRAAYRKRTYSADDAIEAYLMFPASWDFVASSMSEKTSDKLSRAAVKAAIAVYHSVNAELAADFMESYVTGANLLPDSPILSLRRIVPKTHASDIAIYWRAMSAAKAHAEGRPLAKILEATVDMLGNRNTQTVIDLYRDRAIKGALNRRAAQG